MTVVLAHTDTPEGHAALDAAMVEARRRETDLLVFPLSGRPELPSDTGGLTITVSKHDTRDRDVVGEFLDAVNEVDGELIVIGIKRRTAVGKLLLGSAAQHILLEASAPVLAVKAPH